MVPCHASAVTGIKGIKVGKDKSHDLEALKESREAEHLHTQRGNYVKTQGEGTIYKPRKEAWNRPFP